MECVLILLDREQNYKPRSSPLMVKVKNGCEVRGMKEWRCILVNHHDDVGKAIVEWEQAGWQLHSYTTAGMGGSLNYTVNHYLLFYKGQ